MERPDCKHLAHLERFMARDVFTLEGTGCIGCKNTAACYDWIGYLFSGRAYVDAVEKIAGKRNRVQVICKNWTSCSGFIRASPYLSNRLLGESGFVKVNGEWLCPYCARNEGDNHA